MPFSLLTGEPSLGARLTRLRKSYGSFCATSGLAALPLLALVSPVFDLGVPEDHDEAHRAGRCYGSRGARRVAGARLVQTDRHSDKAASNDKRIGGCGSAGSARATTCDLAALHPMGRPQGQLQETATLRFDQGGLGEAELRDINIDARQSGGSVPCAEGCSDQARPTALSAKAWTRATSSSRAKRPEAPPWPAAMLTLKRTGLPLVECSRRRATHFAGSQ